MEYIASLVVVLLSLLGPAYEDHCFAGKINQYYEDGSIDYTESTASAICNHIRTDDYFIFTEVKRIYGNTYRVRTVLYAGGDFPENVAVHITYRTTE